MANDKPQTRAELKQSAAEVGDTRKLTPAEIQKSAREAELAAKEAVAAADKAMLASGQPAAERAYEAAGYGTMKRTAAPAAPKPSTKPSPTFMASMERTIAGLDKDAPENLLPEGFDEKPAAKAKPVQAASSPKPKARPEQESSYSAASRKAMDDLVEKYALSDDAPAPRAPVVTSQDKVEQGIARVTNGKLTQSQRTEAFINELATNKHFAARFGVSANSTGKLDLDGDRQVETREYEAVANTLWRDARFKSIEKIAETLGNDKQIAEAAKAFGGSMQEGTQVALRIIPQGDPDKGGHHR